MGSGGTGRRDAARAPSAALRNRILARSRLPVLVSFFPATAPMAMPNRIAMGATAWWEPVAAAALALTAIAGLVQFAGRIYTRAILHGGPALKLRDAWRGTPAPGVPAPEGRRRQAQEGAARAPRPRRQVSPGPEVPATGDVATCTARRRAAYRDAEG
jgi:ABC-2 type transport system permease protein